ncbi:MAG: F420-0:gamma-glutamyl ligase-like protein [Candidatus Berkelbacteria bacterium Licking1014_96]|uniref:F420-0:gamma-glutamyl ligase-like protein n=1 Tax=Candidatus Berkelbacteria bacterium Licking1014_96 TaxID=2017149 RepID=A0A554LH99_9BACT|nr:MAG: F420-0:gamma-glutamyl ligase-like protein [Candidatus Berkelbacteria bacterium Licking1014_96]
MADLKPNKDKPLKIKVGGEEFERLPIPTRLIKPGDDMVDFVVSYAKKHIQPNDVVVFSEKATAVAQGRAYHVDSVKVSKLANFLVKFVSKSDKGIGISSPQTFQLALEDCGTLRILFAAFCAALTKPFGIKGVFYYVAGEKAALIDGAAEYVMPPYNKYVSKGPIYADELCQEIAAKLDHQVKVGIVDINDYGGRLVGRSDRSLSKKLVTEIMEDNPLGQSREMTPIGILRKIQI